jgi:hypothetical protein
VALERSVTQHISFITLLNKEKIMTTHFISAEIDLQETPAELQKAIEAELKKQGEPLRWAVTAVDIEKEKVTVEAVVTIKNV